MPDRILARVQLVAGARVDPAFSRAVLAVMTARGIAEDVLE